MIVDAFALALIAAATPAATTPPEIGHVRATAFCTAVCRLGPAIVSASANDDIVAFSNRKVYEINYDSDAIVNVEIGALLNCGKAGCGYYNFVAGGRDWVAANWAGMDGATGFWHSHPHGSTESDLAGHMCNVYRMTLSAKVQGVKMGIPFAIFTTIGNNVMRQVYGGIEDKDTNMQADCVGTIDGGKCN